MRISDWSSDVCSSDLKQTATLTYVDLIESRNALRFTVAIGDRRPLNCTAGGRVLLASLPDVELRRYLRGLKTQALTAETETDKRKPGDAIAQASETGAAQTVDQAAAGRSGRAGAGRT